MQVYIFKIKGMHRLGQHIKDDYMKNPKQLRWAITLFTFALIHFYFSFPRRASLCSAGCQETHSVAQDGLYLRDLSSSSSPSSGVRGVCHHALPYSILLKEG